MRERVISFGKDNLLKGVVVESSAKIDIQRAPFIIFLNAGLVHKIGPNRLYVNISRKLASIGINSLRFDFSSIGESQNNKIYYDIKAKRIDEIKSAILYIKTRYNYESFIIAGICSGADFAFYAANEIDSVIGLILINGQYLDTEELNFFDKIIESSIRKRYYKKKIFNINKWINFLAGKKKKLNLSKIFSFFKMKKAQTYKLQVPDNNFWDVLINKKKHLLIIYSEGSPTFDLFNLCHKAKVMSLSRQTKLINLEFVWNSDHTFTTINAQNRLTNIIMNWVEKF